MGQKDSIRCAVCSKIYGILMGDMPAGKMTWTYSQSSIPAYPGFGMWTIDYRFPHGVSKTTNIPYKGTSRTAYLPDTPEGREVLALLVKAFERRHTFTIGTSVTTGQKNCVIWAGIHHKTAFTGGSTNYGYPDPTYFNRVKEELADRGVTLED